MTAPREPRDELREAARVALHEARRGLIALRLEVPHSVAEDVNQRVESAFAALARLAHPEQEAE